MKKWLSFLLMISLLFCLVGCGGSNTSSDEGTSKEKESTQSDSTSEEKSDTTDSETENQEYTVGSTFESDGISITLNSATYYPGDEFNTPPAGSKYLLLNFTIKNNTDSDYDMGEIGFSGFVDGAKADTLAIAPNYLQTTELIPDTETTGDLDYEVPENWSEVKMQARIGAVNGKEATFVITPNDVTQTQ